MKMFMFIICANDAESIDEERRTQRDRDERSDDGHAAD